MERCHNTGRIAGGGGGVRRQSSVGPPVILGQSSSGFALECVGGSQETRRLRRTGPKAGALISSHSLPLTSPAVVNCERGHHLRIECPLMVAVQPILAVHERVERVRQNSLVRAGTQKTTQIHEPKVLRPSP